MELFHRLISSKWPDISRNLTSVLPLSLRRLEGFTQTKCLYYKHIYAALRSFVQEVSKINRTLLSTRYLRQLSLNYAAWVFVELAVADTKYTI